MTKQGAIDYFVARKVNGERLLCNKCLDAEDWAIKALESYPEWVSVKDRLPTYKELHDEQVLALFEDGDIASVGFDECMEPDEYFGYWKQNFDPETLGATDSEWIAIPYVTHWMKKPELPEEP